MNQGANGTAECVHVRMQSPNENRNLWKLKLLPKLREETSDVH